MDFYLGLAQVIGVHTLLGLSAWCVLHTGQVSLAQGGFFAIGASSAGLVGRGGRVAGGPGEGPGGRAAAAWPAAIGVERAPAVGAPGARLQEPREDVDHFVARDALRLGSLAVSTSSMPEATKAASTPATRSTSPRRM